MKKILFLCTGNYYRSRFSEEYFNFHAKQKRLPWLADSMGIMRDFHGNGNTGPISQHTLDELSRLGVEPTGHSRYPKHVYVDDLAKFDRVVAVSREEHQTMLVDLWPNDIQLVEYFDVEDLHIEGSDTALPRLKLRLDTLIAELHAAEV